MTPAPSLDENPDRPRVVVVGGGISGLSAAHQARLLLPDVDVVVVEAGDRLGGKLRLEEVGGRTVDVGAESILNRRPEAVELAREVGLAERVVHPVTTQAQVWSRGRMRAMPRTVMGVPADLKDLDQSGVLSRPGLARVALEPRMPPSEIGDTDVSVGWLIEHRLGREVLERLVEPLLGGVYAGHAWELSARATVPQVVSLLDEDRSLLRAAAARLEQRSADTPVFAGLVGGVGQLPAAVAAGLEVHLHTTVRALRPTAEGRWSLEIGSAAAPHQVGADAVVVAVPATPASRLLEAAAPAAALELGRIESASMAVVTMAFPRHDFPAVHGSGFLVPPVEGKHVKAATYSFAKWAWMGAADSGPGGDLVVVRASVGRHREEQELQVEDDELVERCVSDLARMIGLSVRPVDARVTRWGGALPQYTVGHLDRVRSIRQSVQAAGALRVCGAAYDGIGIAACVASGLEAGRQIAEALTADAPTR